MAVAAMLLVSAEGCKTQDDAAAAATQMAATGQALVAYYATLDKEVTAREDALEIRATLDHIKPMDMSAMATTSAELKQRAALAQIVVELSDLFQKLTGSTAPADASAAAVKLDAELVSLKLVGSSDAATQGITQGLQEIVKLVQQHEERKAAQKLAPFSASLWTFFQSEQGLYNSVSNTYLTDAKNVAKLLVQRDQVDVSPLVTETLQPFGLAPGADTSALREPMKEYLLREIDTRAQSKIAASEQATAAMSDSLKEMNSRLTAVAAGQPMKLRLPPLSLSTVLAWLASVSK